MRFTLAIVPLVCSPRGSGRAPANIAAQADLDNVKKYLDDVQMEWQYAILSLSRHEEEGVSVFETIFAIANPVALVGWAGLILLPGRKLVVDGVSGLIIPALLGVAYAGLVGAFFAGAEGGFSSLADVRLLFQSDALLLAGWLHYLAFDLFVGAFEVRTARAEGIPHLLVIPCLVLTFLFGPLGFVLFLIIRLARAPRAALEV